MLPHKGLPYNGDPCSIIFACLDTLNVHMHSHMGKLLNMCSVRYRIRLDRVIESGYAYSHGEIAKVVIIAKQQSIN